MRDGTDKINHFFFFNDCSPTPSADYLLGMIIITIVAAGRIRDIVVVISGKPGIVVIRVSRNETTA